jgi:hypothetical protein
VGVNKGGVADVASFNESVRQRYADLSAKAFSFVRADPHPRPLPARGRGEGYADAVVTPPSTTMVWPVMKVDASDAR